jgi:hypothetical protein
MKITTNHHKRFALRAWEMTPRQSAQVTREHGDWANMEEEEFLFYRGYPYALSMFMKLGYPGPMDSHNNFPGWHGIHHESFFSGLVVRYHENEDAWTIGAYVA